MRIDQPKTQEPMRSTLPNTDQPRILLLYYHYSIIISIISIIVLVVHVTTCKKRLTNCLPKLSLVTRG